MSKPAVRFEASSQGVARALFSVREVPDGSLLIVLRGEKRFGTNPSTLEELRLSVHPSANTTGTTLTIHERTKAGYTKRASFVHESKEFLLFPLFARTCPRLDNEQYDAKSN